MITYNIQLAHFNPDVVEECGVIGKNDAIEVLKKFPFSEEVSKLKTMEEGCTPLLEFKDDNGDSLVFWLDESEKFTIECGIGKHRLGKQNYTDDLDVLVQTLNYFYEKDWERIRQIYNFREPLFRIHPIFIFLLCIEIPGMLLLGNIKETRFSIANFFVDGPSYWEKMFVEFLFYNVVVGAIFLVVLTRKSKR